MKMITATQAAFDSVGITGSLAKIGELGKKYDKAKKALAKAEKDRQHASNGDDGAMDYEKAQAAYIKAENAADDAWKAYMDAQLEAQGLKK